MFALREKHAAMVNVKTPTTTKTIAEDVQSNAPEIGNVATENAKTFMVAMMQTAELAECHVRQVIAVMGNARTQIQTNRTVVFYAQFAMLEKSAA